MEQKRKKFLAEVANADQGTSMLLLFTEKGYVQSYVHGKVQELADMLATMLVSEQQIAIAVMEGLADYYDSEPLKFAAIDLLYRMVEGDETTH